MPYIQDLNHAQALARIKEYLKSPAGFVRWLSECILIPGRGGEVQPFDLWPAQRDVARQIASHQKLVILKARQLGMTWLCLAYFLFKALYGPIKEYRVVSINEQKSGDHLQRIRWMWENLPAWTKPQVEKLNASTIQFRDSGSLIRSLPSTSNAGRGDTLDGLMMDEDAFQALAREIVFSALPALEKREGVLIRLSTANGFGTDHEQIWHKAERKEGGYHPIFLPWSADPARTVEWREKLRADEGDDYVHQEFPESPDEAFLASGRPFFDLGMVESSKATAAKKLPERGVLEGMIPDKIEFVPAHKGELKVWERPQLGVKYVLFADPSRGLESGDDTTIFVMRAAGRHEVARYKGKADVGETTDMMEMLGHWYSHRTASVYNPEDMPALAAVEVNSFGISIAQTLRDRGYRNLFYQRNLVTGDIRQDQPGWESSGKTRRLVLGAFQARFRRGESIVLDTDTLEQMQQFYHRGATGKPQAPDGGHDDCVIGRAGCDYLATLDTAGMGPRAGEKFIDTPEAKELGVMPSGMDYWFRKDQERLALGIRNRSDFEEV